MATSLITSPHVKDIKKLLAVLQKLVNSTPAPIALAASLL